MHNKMIISGTVEAVPFLLRVSTLAVGTLHKGGAQTNPTHCPKIRMAECRSPPPLLRDTFFDRKVSQRAFLSFFLRFSFFIDKEDGE